MMKTTGFPVILQRALQSRMTQAALAIVIFFALISFGQIISQEFRYARLRAELHKYEQLWQSKDISNYSYIISGTAGDAPGFAKVVVRVTAKSSACEVREYPAGGRISQMLVEIDHLDTVPELFDRIRQAINDKAEDGTSKLALSYDPESGYPTYLALDDRQGYAVFVTGRFSYAISNFRVW